MTHMHRRQPAEGLRRKESSKVMHRSAPKRCSLMKLLLMSVLVVCALIVILAHVYVAGKVKSFEANSSPTNVRWKRQTEFQKKTPADKVHKRKVNYHVIFSTTCSNQQDWESYVFFYHAFKVKQPGNVTRLASGCTDEQAKKLTQFHQDHISTMSDRFHVHLTPDYSRIRLTNNRFPYKYMNKPGSGEEITLFFAMLEFRTVSYHVSVRHWMENSLGLHESQPVPSEIENDVIILMDPDMILLRPLLHDFTDQHVIWAKEPDRDNMRVRHGNPMSQQDGYLSSEWVNFNMINITKDQNTPALSVTTKEAPVSWNTGPPYLATVRDMFDVAVKWTEFAPRVFDEYPKLFAEMYGYCIATAHLKLSHTMLKSIVVSTTKTRREGWSFIDALPDDQVCNPPLDADLPFVLHYCKRYWLGSFFFSKYRLRKDYLSCEAPLLTMPTNDIELLDLDYYVPIPPANGQPKPANESEKQPLPDRKQRKRELFMLCGLISKINEAVVYYKQNHCSGNANFNRTYNFHDYPYK